jgi:DNA repair exonuclease SbcCD nuclease subunit
MVDHQTITVTSDRQISRILQTGDLHVEDKHIDDQRPVLRWIAEQAQDVDLLILAGDLCGWPVPYDPSPTEVQAIVDLIQSASMRGVEVIVIGGNHDVFARWRILNGGDEWMRRVRWVETPTSILYRCTGVVPTMVHVMPYPDIGAIVATARETGDVSQAEAVGAYVEKTMAAFAEARKSAICPAFYTGHHGTRGAMSDTGQPLVSEDVDIPWSLIESTGAVGAAMNHVHLHQVVSGPDIPMVHVGSPYQRTFGETGVKYVGLFALADGGCDFTAIPTPSKRLRAYDARWVFDPDNITDGRWDWADGEGPGHHDGERVRVRLKYPAEIAGTFQARDIAALFPGAEVVVERQPAAKRRERMPELRDAKGLTEQFTTYCDQVGIAYNDATLDLLRDTIYAAGLGEDA